MRCSSTEPDRAVRPAVLAVGLAVALGALTGLGLAAPLPTAALLTDSAVVGAEITVRPCDPARWDDAVDGLAPVRREQVAPGWLRYADVAAEGLTPCDDGTLAWDLAGLPAGGRTDDAPLGLVSPQTATLTLLTATGGQGPQGEPGELVSLLADDGTRLHLRTTADARIELGASADGTPTSPLLVSEPLDPTRTHLVTAVLTGTTVTLHLDATEVGSVASGWAAPVPLTLVVGALATDALGSSAAVVDEVLVLETPLSGAQVAALATAARAW